MRTMEFTIENIEAFRIGQTLEVTEGKLPTSYFSYNRTRARHERKLQKCRTIEDKNRHCRGDKRDSAVPCGGIGV